MTAGTRSQTSRVGTALEEVPLGGWEAERLRIEMARRAAGLVAPGEESFGTPADSAASRDNRFVSGETAENAFALLDRGPASAAPVATTLPLVAQDDWIQIVTRGTADTNTPPHNRPADKPFAPGEVMIPDSSFASEVRMGRMGRVSYLYWADRHNAVVASGPDKAFNRLSFKAGDWQIWCAGAVGVARCRVGVSLVDRESRRREAVLTVFFDAARNVHTVCAGRTEDGGSVTLKVDRNRTYRVANGTCLLREESRALLGDLEAGASVVATHTRPGAATSSGELNPYGLGEALKLMSFMGGRGGRTPVR
ncbi:MAG: hypothetical protein OEW11_04195 [Nitrospirota bacterium]|nr:hypothetical protein [Nitrospirota bacterium]